MTVQEVLHASSNFKIKWKWLASEITLKTVLELETSVPSVAFLAYNCLWEDKIGHWVFYVSETLIEGKVSPYLDIFLI